MSLRGELEGWHEPPLFTRQGVEALAGHDWFFERCEEAVLHRARVGWAFAIVVSGALVYLGVIDPWVTRRQLVDPTVQAELAPWEAARGAALRQALERRATPNYYTGVVLAVALPGLCAVVFGSPWGPPAGRTGRRRSRTGLPS